MKHIAVDFHFVRDKVTSDQLRMAHISTPDQLVDALAKLLSRQRLFLLRSKIDVSKGTSIL